MAKAVQRRARDTRSVLLPLSVLADGSPSHRMLMTLATAALWMAYTVLWGLRSEFIKRKVIAGGIALINTIGLSGA